MICTDGVWWGDRRRMGRLCACRWPLEEEDSRDKVWVGMCVGERRDVLSSLAISASRAASEAMLVDGWMDVGGGWEIRWLFFLALSVVSCSLWLSLVSLSLFGLSSLKSPIKHTDWTDTLGLRHTDPTRPVHFRKSSLLLLGGLVVHITSNTSTPHTQTTDREQRMDKPLRPWPS